MSHRLDFVRQDKDNEATFDFVIDTETAIIGKKKGGADVDKFTLKCKFRADYNILSKEKDLDFFQQSTGLLGHQIYPTIREHMVHVLGLTGVNPHFLPFSLSILEDENTTDPVRSKDDKGKKQATRKRKPSPKKHAK